MNDASPDAEGAFVLLTFVGDEIEPSSLTSLIPIPSVRSKKKGHPLGPSRDGKTPVAKTGYCAFSTADLVESEMLNDHVKLILSAIEDIAPTIKSIMEEQSISWQAVLFEGNSEGGLSIDVDTAFLQKMDQIGLPFSFEKVSP